MKKLLRTAVLTVLLSVLSAGVLSCSDNEPEQPVEKDTLLLVYAIAANNGLQSDLYSDMNEMLSAAPELDLSKNVVLVYLVDNSNECKLQKLAKSSGGYTFVTETTFPELPLSTSGERISEVLNYVNENYRYDSKGLVLWSHGTGWIPSENGSTPRSVMRTFGRDKYEGVNYETDITELAAAIPSGVFDYIWFDCCYMANIETVYQLRNKTRFIVGYVEEISSYGMPYDLTLPYLVRKEPDLVGAADMIYTYYDRLRWSAPVSITDTGKLEELSAVAKRIFAQGTPPSDLSGIQNYTRPWLTAEKVYYYDMEQLLESYQGISSGLISELQNAMSNAVVYKVLSDYTWPGPVINPNHFSGLSMHNYVDNDSEDERFYRTLDWYKATR